MFTDQTTARPWTRLLRGLRRPFRAPGVRPPGAVHWVSGVSWLAWLALVAVLSQGHSISWPGVALFAGLVVAGDLLLVPVAGNIAMSCSDIFWIAAFATLPVTDSLAVVVLAVGIAAWRGAITVPGILPIGATGWNYLAALAAASAVRHRVNEPLGIVLAVAAAFAALRAAEFVYLAWYTFLTAEGSAASRRRAAWQHATGYLSAETAVQIAAQAPMAVLGALAATVYQPAVALLVLPYLIAWRSAHQAAKLAEAERLMGIDGLTGLVNRARFFERAADELALAGRYGHGVALVMGDLDNFKRINDTLGHLVGDDVLRATAEALRSSIDESLFPAARYGGEEFVVLLPAVEHADVLRLVEQVRRNVETNLSQWGATISLGVAYLRTGDRLESLVDRADKALYSAKFAGKNRVHEWPPGAEARSPVAAA